MRLACCQIEIEPGDVVDNRERAIDAVERAAERGADLAILPELFTVGYFSFDLYARRAEAVEGETLTRVAEAAADNDVAVLAGSIVEDLGETRAVPTPDDEGYANTSVFFDRDGERRAVYRKHHLFGYGSDEADLLVPGESLPTVEFEGFTLGFTTCYDLRFPELYRDLVDAGTTLCCIPSAWPYPRVEHWTTLTRARAIENQWYLATANGVGEFEDATLLGRSSVYGPWGTTLAGSSDTPRLVVADPDPDRVRAVREEFPALADRRC